MPKSKGTTPKIKKPRATKYTKMAAHAEKELTAKKKALVAAEKRLAKAHKTHADLLAETARLDMLVRSLDAVNKGLEPPQNIKYVYTYPYWIYNGSGWYYTSPNTITIGTPNGGLGYQGQTGYVQNGQTVTFTNTGTPICETNAGNFQFNSGFAANNSSIPSGVTGSQVWTTSSADPNTSYAFTVDLTTHAPSEEEEQAELAGLQPEELKVGVGG